MTTYEGARDTSVGLPQSGTTARSRLGQLVQRLRSAHAATLFLALALPVGLFLVVAIPPVQGLDELNHFYRAYSISGGAFVEPVRDWRAGDVLPACVTVYSRNLFSTATRPGRLHPGTYLAEPTDCRSQPAVWTAFDNTAVYSPVSYLPQTIGVGLARAVGAAVPEVFYAGRLAALLAFAGLVWLALRITPVGRPVLLVIGLMPMTLILGTQYSADGMTIAYALLLVAAVARCIWHPDATWRAFLLAVAAATALSLSKSTYFALAPLLLLVPHRLFPRWWIGLAAKLGALVAMAGLVGLWFWQVRHLDPGGGGIMGVNPRQQVQVILHDPVWYARFVLTTVLGPGTSYFTWQGFVSWVGFSRSVTAGQPSPPPLIMVAGVALVILAYGRELPRQITLTAGTAVRALWPAALAIGNVVLIVTILYLTVVEVGGHALWLQGRYLLPLAVVPILSARALGAPDDRPRSIVTLLPLVLVLLVYLVGKVLVYFYQ